MSWSVLTAQQWVDQGHQLRELGDAEGAEAAFRRAIAAAPNEPNPVHNLGVVQHLQGRLSEAEASLRQALRLAPERAITRSALGAVLLCQGRFAEGFPLLDEWRNTAERGALAAPDLPIPRWKGEDLRGRRVLIWSEEGFGDQIMFARFAGAMRDQGATVVWLCPPELAPLFQHCLGVEVRPSDQSTELSGFDFYCQSSALPAVVLPHLKEISSHRYLRLPEPILLPNVRIGIVTSGNPGHPQDLVRSLPSQFANRLLALPGTASLDPAVTGATNFLDTARIIAGLDLVLSVDTAVAHLAGALGKPVWVLLREPACEWRWLQGRQDSPWYASARLFRQPRPGAWEDVIAAIERSLGYLTLR